MIVGNTNSDRIPPPPPLPPTEPHRNLPVKEITDTLCCISEEWEKELQDAFQRVNRDEKYIGLYIYNHVDSVIQQGPTCGLVSLVMAAKLLNFQVTVEEALKLAREKQYSNQGEMFTAAHMKDLMELLIPAEVILLRGMERNRSSILDHLVKGWPLLVPYDADANHEPAIKGGHRAHWAIVLGFCILEPCQEQCIKDLRPLLNKTNCNTTYNCEKLPNNLLMILAKQGKSRYIKWWKFDQLCYSNLGLNSINPKISNSEDRDDFVLPENGNLKESLANQFLMIKPK